MSQKAGDIIKKYQTMGVEEISNQTPNTISAEIVLLSAKLWEAGSLVLATERGKTRKWLDIRHHTTTNKEADEQIKLTDEYKDYQEAKYSEKVVLEIIKSLKKLLASKVNESFNTY